MRPFIVAALAPARNFTTSVRSSACAAEGVNTTSNRAAAIERTAFMSKPLFVIVKLGGNQ
jgi:hypothetical protein